MKCFCSPVNEAEIGWHLLSRASRAAARSAAASAAAAAFLASRRRRRRAPRGLLARALTAVKGMAENTSTPASSCHDARTGAALRRRLSLRRGTALGGAAERSRRRGGRGGIELGWDPLVSVGRKCPSQTDAVEETGTGRSGAAPRPRLRKTITKDQWTTD